MKNQALFSLKDKSKKLKCRLLSFLFGTLRVNRKKLWCIISAQILTTPSEKRTKIHPGPPELP